MNRPRATIGNQIVDVAAFIDWNSQLLLCGRDSESDPHGAAELALRQTTRRIARCLADIDSTMRFRVGLRLYHGWHQGYQPTSNRKAAQLAIGQADFATLSQRANVVFSPAVGFGDRLTSALDRRLHVRLSIHLPNTLRTRHGSERAEKMVDTALASDVVVAAFDGPNDWIVVVAEDDDLIPPMFVAEAVLAGSGARVVLLRKSQHANMLALDGILVSG